MAKFIKKKIWIPNLFIQIIPRPYCNRELTCKIYGQTQRANLFGAILYLVVNLFSVNIFNVTVPKTAKPLNPSFSSLFHFFFYLSSITNRSLPIQRFHLLHLFIPYPLLSFLPPFLKITIHLIRSSFLLIRINCSEIDTF